MKQTVVAFGFGLSREGVHVTTKIEDQLNDFLQNHPNYSICSMSTIVTSIYQEVFVVFDIREPEKEQKNEFKNNNGKDNRYNGQGGNQRKS